MSPRKHHLTRILTALAVAAFALTVVAGTLGIPTKTPDPISAPAIFEDPFDF